MKLGYLKEITICSKHLFIFTDLREHETYVDDGVITENSKKCQQFLSRRCRRIYECTKQVE